MADFAYGSAHNRKVDRYVPIEEIRQALRNVIGDKCDTDQYIYQYLEKESASFASGQGLDGDFFRYGEASGFL